MELLTQQQGKLEKAEKFMLTYRERYLHTEFISERIQVKFKQSMPRLLSMIQDMAPCLDTISNERQNFLKKESWNLPEVCITGKMRTLQRYEMPKYGLKPSLKHFFTNPDSVQLLDIYFMKVVLNHFSLFMIMDWVLNLAKMSNLQLTFEELKEVQSCLLFDSYLQHIYIYRRFFLKYNSRPAYLTEEKIKELIENESRQPSINSREPISNFEPRKGTIDQTPERKRGATEVDLSSNVPHKKSNPTPSTSSKDESSFAASNSQRSTPKKII